LLLLLLATPHHRQHHHRHVLSWSGGPSLLPPTGVSFDDGMEGHRMTMMGLQKELDAMATMMMMMLPQQLEVRVATGPNAS
jgi:hypothetical protein